MYIQFPSYIVITVTIPWMFTVNIFVLDGFCSYFTLLKVGICIQKESLILYFFIQFNLTLFNFLLSLIIVICLPFLAIFSFLSIPVATFVSFVVFVNDAVWGNQLTFLFKPINRIGKTRSLPEAISREIVTRRDKHDINSYTMIHNLFAMESHGFDRHVCR